MKLCEKSICLALILTIALNFTGFAAGCDDISKRVLRLHVLANSDTAEDQALKLRVRDRVLEESTGLLDHVTDRAQAEKAVSQNIQRFQRAAEDEIRKQGYEYPVHVELTHMYFTTREYDEVTLPAGEYDALRVVIGSGKGHNWWCVMFPPMCLPAAEEKKELKDVLNQYEMSIVEGKNHYIVKFKSVEIYEQFRQWLENKQ